MQQMIRDSTTYDYLLHLPREYQKTEKWPLILFLHGTGSEGEAADALKSAGLPRVIEEIGDFPFVVVSPLKGSSTWSTDLLTRLIEEVSERYRVDTERIYLTGTDAGAFAAWQLGIEQPEKFAAVAPVGGGADPKDVCKLRDLPVWTFHGVWDSNRPISESQAMVLALKLCGGNVKFTIYPERAVDYTRSTYGNPDLFGWFLQQSRSAYKQPEPDPVWDDLD